MLGQTPETLAVMLAPVDDATLRTRPEAGEWCPLEVVGHLIACDSGAFRDRIRAIVSGDGVIPAFRPWDAIDARDFAAEPLDDLLDELRAERETSTAYLATLTAEDLARTGSMEAYPGVFAAGDFVHEWPFHDQEHFQQILACTKLAYLPHMSDTMRDALTGQ